MKTILVFIIIFSVVVVIHEFGHYFFAKRAGILVREFAIGMGPKLFAHQAKDGTTYTIRMLPLGGYVQMAGWGEDETELTPVCQSPWFKMQLAKLSKSIRAKRFNCRKRSLWK